MCVSRWEQGGPPIVCTQNPTSGEEFRRGWHPERLPQAANADNDVLVVGAGPAGMECAMILGARGMRRVHLVDADREMGGHLQWLTRLPGLGQWRRVVTYRQTQLAKLRNVDVRPGHDAVGRRRARLRCRVRRDRDRRPLARRRHDQPGPCRTSEARRPAAC